MAVQIIYPENYKSLLSLPQTEEAIMIIKDTFQANLSSGLNLRRVTAPLFVQKGTGINDDLNGIEKPVSFPIKSMNGAVVEIVQSLAKWKRLMLAEYKIEKGSGIYTDMNAVRPDEDLSNIHSVYVDQWDWERVISAEERNTDFLKSIVREIYKAIKLTENTVCDKYPAINPILPEEITFIHSEDLFKMYPELTPKEREDKIVKEHIAVFVIGIGGDIGNGTIHDGRAPDYDDWSTETSDGKKGLNGDILLWNPVLNRSLEVSSMGIRVNKDSLLKQLQIRNAEERKNLYFHKRLLNDELPLSIGGGIGQSRLCMYLLRKIHIGEIQASVWPEDMIKEFAKRGVFFV